MSFSLFIYAIGLYLRLLKYSFYFQIFSTEHTVEQNAAHAGQLWLGEEPGHRAGELWLVDMGSRDPSARLWLANLQATIADKQSTKTETKSLDHLDLIKTVGTGQIVSDIYKLFP